MRTFQRGFFCADVELRYPYRECQISVPMLLLCMLLLPMLFISVVEIMRVCKAFRFRQYSRNLWSSLGTFSAGFVATYLTTELAKNVIGRLRPHFYAGCEPRLTDGSTCEEERNAGAFVTQYYCSNRLLSNAQIRELHVSFPSAHASLSFYSMLFLAFYLHAVWRKGRGWCRVLRHILQFLVLLVAWYVSLSRVADYWHHWSDVLAGGVMGVAFAVITAVYIGGLLSWGGGRASCYRSSIGEGLHLPYSRKGMCGGGSAGARSKKELLLQSAAAQAQMQALVGGAGGASGGVGAAGALPTTASSSSGAITTATAGPSTAEADWKMHSVLTT